MSTKPSSNSHDSQLFCDTSPEVQHCFCKLSPGRQPKGPLKREGPEARILVILTKHNGTVIDQSVLIGYGINEFGRRELLGASVSLSEAEVYWRQFLESLQRRGLKGLKLVTSDDHSGLRSSLRFVFPSVLWQRCQFHMSQNAQHYAPRKHLCEEISSATKDSSGSVSEWRLSS